MIVDGSGELHIRLSKRSGRATRRPCFCRSTCIVRASARCRAALRPPTERPAHQPSPDRPATDVCQQQAPTDSASPCLRRSRHWAVARATSRKKILRSDHAQLPSVEWKDSHARRTANRLIHDSIALVERGYLKFLRGADARHHPSPAHRCPTPAIATALPRRWTIVRALPRNRGTHASENLRPPPTPELSATVTPTCRDLAAALRGKTEASHARQVRAARHALRPNP